MRLSSSILSLVFALGLAGPAGAAITFHTVNAGAAVGQAPGLVDGFFAIRGDGSDFPLVPSGYDPAYANPDGALSWTYTSYGDPPFVTVTAFDVNQFFTGTVTWDNFVVSGNTVGVREFSIDLEQINTDRPFTTPPLPGATLTYENVPGTPQSVTVDLDGTMSASYTAQQEFLGPALPGIPVGGITEIDVSFTGAFILNTPGRDTASADQFDTAPVVPPQSIADYLNFVRDSYLPADWTSAGIWLTDDVYTQDNTRGQLAPFLHGASYANVSLFYTTESFLFGQELADADGDGLFSNDEVASLVASGAFPEILGLNLAGDGFAQLYDIELLEGDSGATQTIVFEYDESALAPGDELLLAIAHFVDGAWTIPGNQVLDIDADTITVTLDDFSPFALVTVPLPPALALLAPALGLLAARRRRVPRCR